MFTEDPIQITVILCTITLGVFGLLNAVIKHRISILNFFNPGETKSIVMVSLYSDGKYEKVKCKMIQNKWFYHDKHGDYFYELYESGLTSKNLAWKPISDDMFEFYKGE